MKLGELFFDLGFKADTMKLSEFIKGVGDLNMSSVMAGASFGALVGMTGKMLEGTTEMTREMRLFGLETGLSSQKMQQWSLYAEQLGASKDAVKGSLIAFNETVNQAKMGNVSEGLAKAISLLNTLGNANITQDQIFGKDADVFSVLDTFLGAMKNIDPQFQGTIMRMANLNSQLLVFRDLTNDQKNTRDTLAVPSDSDIDKMKELSQQWSQVAQNMAVVGRVIAVEISGPLTSLIKTLSEAGGNEFFKMLATGVGNAARILDIGTTYAMAINENLYSDALARKFGIDPVGRGVPVAGNVNITVHGVEGNPNSIAEKIGTTFQQYLNQTYYGGQPRTY